MAVIGDLVANITASTAGFTSGLNAARSQLGSFAGGMRSSIAGLGSVIAGVGAPLAAIFGIKEAIGAFRESEQAGKKLDAVLAATGGAAGVTGDEIRALASDLQKVTNFEDDATIGAAGVLATFTQIKGDVFKGAIVAAQDLSAVMGQDLNSSIVQVGKALNNPIKGVTALQRVGVSFSAEQKAQIKALQESGDLVGAQAIIMKELQNEFGGAAQAMADPLTILGNTVGDIAEGIGSAIVPALNEMATFIVSMIVPAGGTMADTFKVVGDVLVDWVGVAIQFINDSITLAGFVIENFGQIAEYAFLSSQLAAVTFAEDLSYFFTTTLPALFQWFSSNWGNIWFTAVDTVLTLLINLGQNIRNFFSALWDFIASGGEGSFEFAFTPLLEGAVSTLSKLPDVPKRAMSDLEKQLTKDTERIGEDLGDKLGDAMIAAAKPVIEKPKFNAPDLSAITGGEGGAAVSADSKKGAGVALQGSKEALSSIFANMRGGKDLNAMMLKVQQDALEESKRQTKLAEDAAEDTEVVEIG